MAYRLSSVTTPSFKVCSRSSPGPCRGPNSNGISLSLAGTATIAGNPPKELPDFSVVSFQCLSGTISAGVYTDGLEWVNLPLPWYTAANHHDLKTEN